MSAIKIAYEKEINQFIIGGAFGTDAKRLSEQR